MLRKFKIIALTAGVLATAFWVAPSEARIRCDGRYQVIDGQSSLSTPYCEDRYLAVVARGSFGVSTSFAAIRGSVFEKQRVCRIVGHDSRVNDICLQYLDGRDNRQFN